MKVQILSFLIVILSISIRIEGEVFDDIKGILYGIRDSIDQYKQSPQNRRDEKEYDFIIVGAGTAGCVLANRLTENKNWKVLVLEAGVPEEFIMDMPIAAIYLQFIKAINWDYRTEPTPEACLGMKNNQCFWPRGRVIGGSSVLNYMFYSRGSPKDYDLWEEKGNKGWSYKDVLPYFKKIEDFAIPEMFNSTYHSRGGHLTVSYPKYRTKLAETLMRASEEIGWKYVDYNSGDMLGISYAQVSVKDGVRHSSSRAYLYPVKHRPNLHVKSQSYVKKILIDSITKEAYGVQYESNGRVRTAIAKKEVILSAGALASPHLLMLSGVGPKTHLENIGIDVLQDSKVGYNLMDHITCGGITYLVNDSITLKESTISTRTYVTQWLKDHDGPLSVPGGIEAVSFHDTQNLGYPDIELLYLGGSIASERVFYNSFGIRRNIYEQVYGNIIDKDSFMVFPMLLHPKSKGRIKLASKDPYVKPLIYSGYLEHPDDVKTIIRGIRLLQNLTNQSAMKAFDTKLHSVPIPQCRRYEFDSDEYWECATRMFTLTIYHYSGTCKMGPDTDKEAVVNPRLQVYGIKRLRVIDASIMPTSISGHTNAPTYMIAEKGADMIKEDYANVLR